jgi:hypothetical protein
LSSLLSAVKEFDYARITSAIEESLLEVHEKHIWPKQLDNQFQCLIAIQGLRPTCSRSLVITQETTLLPVDEYKAIGAGADMGDYLRRV